MAVATPTLDEIKDALSRNADYEEVGSVAKARAYITAARRALSEQPSSAADQGSSVTFDIPLIRDEMTRAREYVQANENSTSGVRFLTAKDGFRR